MDNSTFAPGQHLGSLAPGRLLPERLRGASPACLPPVISGDDAPRTLRPACSPDDAAGRLNAAMLRASGTSLFSKWGGGKEEKIERKEKRENDVVVRPHGQAQQLNMAQFRCH